MNIKFEDLIGELEVLNIVIIPRRKWTTSGANRNGDGVLYIYYSK